MQLLLITFVIENDYSHIFAIVLGVLLFVGLPIGLAMVWDDLEDFLSNIKYNIFEFFKELKRLLRPKRLYCVPRKEVRKLERSLNVEIMKHLYKYVDTPVGKKLFPDILSELLPNYAQTISSLTDYRVMHDNIKTSNVEKREIRKIYNSEVTKFKNAFIKDYEELNKKKTNEIIEDVRERFKLE